jgi:hypothetical protein
MPKGRDSAGSTYTLQSSLDQWPSSADRPAVGTKISVPIILSCEIRDGKIVKAREYFDMWSLVDPGTPHHLYS